MAWKQAVGLCCSEKGMIMKKRPPVAPQRRTRFAGKPVTPGRAPRFNPLQWLMLPAVCFGVLLLSAGIISAHADTPSTLSPLAAHKQQVVQQQHADGQANSRPKTAADAHAPAVQPAPARQAGISNAGQGPFSASFFTVRNSWQGPVGGDWVFAYAGAKPNADRSSGQGSIVLYTQTVNAFGGYDFHPVGTFAAPTGTTALTIVAVKGTLLQLRSDTGQALAFNLATHQFA